MARRLSRAGVRRRPRRGGHRDGEPRAARFARQHAEGQARKNRSPRSPISAPNRRRGRRSACASNSAPTRAIPASMPRRTSSRAPSRCRTRARSWRRLLSAAKPGEQVIDLCAGAGGKTLALAAMMQGKGRLIATDHDKRQLAPIYERLSRAGVHNADIRTPKGDADPLGDIQGLRRPRADRRALHRNRHLAPQPRRQMADAPGRARGAAEGPGRSA